MKQWITRTWRKFKLLFEIICADSYYVTFSFDVSKNNIYRRTHNITYSQVDAMVDDHNDIKSTDQVTKACIEEANKIINGEL